ncbi:MAG: YceI family protein [Pyrinomonadaceae bacterium]
MIKAHHIPLPATCNCTGVTKSITFSAKIGVTADAITFESTFSINRKDFGIVK